MHHTRPQHCCMNELKVLRHMLTHRFINVGCAYLVKAAWYDLAYINPGMINT